MERKYVLCSIVIVALMIVTSFSVMAPIGSPAEQTQRARISAYTPHAPIWIDGNADFAAKATVNGWPGDGTESDPYIIRGLEIDMSTLPPFSKANGIDITRNTTSYFIIRDCYIHGVYGEYVGIVVRCPHGTLENNICSNTQYGIVLEEASASGNIVVNNTCRYNSWYGISLRYVPSYGAPSNNNLIDNSCSSNGVGGIDLKSSNGNTLSDNNCSNNGWGGVNLESSNGNTLSDNICSNTQYGIPLVSSNNNTLSNNTCDSNTQNGIYLHSSSGNTLSDNICSNGVGGIYIESSSGNTLSDNICSSNDYDGIILISSNSNTISGSICSNSAVGIHLESSNGNTLSNNTCNSNTQFGIYLGSSSSNALSNNTCSNNYYGVCLFFSGGNTISNNTCSNNYYGVCLVFSGGNTISNNTCNFNSNYGIYLESSSDSNRIWNNTLNGNNIQAYDECTNNHWNSTSGYGNWWSDWQTPNIIAPYDIVDLPYNIEGSAGAKDYCPKTTPISCTITAPTANPTIFTTWHMIYLMGTATDYAKITSVTWSNSLGGSGIAYMNPQYGAANVTWQSRGNVLLYSGVNVITVTAHDAAGNTATDTLTVTYMPPESIPPTCTITDPTSNPTMTTGWHMIYLRGTATDNIKVTSVTWTNSLGGSGVAYMNPQFGGASVTWQSRGNVHLLPGDNVITVTATDSNGNTATDTLTVTYTGL